MEFAGAWPKLFALIFLAHASVIGFAAAASTPGTLLPAALVQALLSL